MGSSAPKSFQVKATRERPRGKLVGLHQVARLALEELRDLAQLVPQRQIGKQHVDPPRDEVAAGEAERLVHRLEERHVCLALGGARELAEHEPERGQPRVEPETVERIGSVLERAPIDRAAEERDSGNAAQGADRISEVARHDVEQRHVRRDLGDVVGRGEPPRELARALGRPQQHLFAELAGDGRPITRRIGRGREIVATELELHPALVPHEASAQLLGVARDVRRERLQHAEPDVVGGQLEGAMLRVGEVNGEQQWVDLGTVDDLGRPPKVHEVAWTEPRTEPRRTGLDLDLGDGEGDAHAPNRTAGA